MYPAASVTPSATIAEVLFPLDGERLVVSVSRELARDALAADVLTQVVARTADRSSAEQEIHQLAEALDWSVSVEPEGITDHVTVGRA